MPAGKATVLLGRNQRGDVRSAQGRADLLLDGILGPHDAWPLLRGMRTLPARLRQHDADALHIATALGSHPAVARVYHPAFDEIQDLVRSQLRGYSGVFSVSLRRGEYEAVPTVVDTLQRFRIGVSWGGVESVVISPARRVREPTLASQGLPDGLIRLSIGLEGADLLLDDLVSALNAVA